MLLSILLGLGIAGAVSSAPVYVFVRWDDLFRGCSEVLVWCFGSKT